MADEVEESPLCCEAMQGGPGAASCRVRSNATGSSAACSADSMLVLRADTRGRWTIRGAFGPPRRCAPAG